MSTGKPDRRDGSQLVEVIRDLLEESMVRPLCADLDRLPVAEEALPGAGGGELVPGDESDSRNCRVCGAPIEVYLGKRRQCRACMRAALSDDARERERETSRAWKDRNRERNRKRDRGAYSRKAS